MKSQRIPKVIVINPEGNMNVCTNLNASPSKGPSDISLQTTHVNLMVAIVEKKSEDHKSH